MATATVLALPSYYPAANEKIRVEGVYDPVGNLKPYQTPPGFPKQLHGPLVWTKESMMAQEEHWIIKLNEVETEAIEAALRFFQGSFDASLAPGFAHKH